MRRIMQLAIVAGMLSAEPCLAGRQEVTLSSGYNETALKSEFNRGTAMTFEANFGRYVGATSFDSRGLGSIGFGPIVSATDFQRQTQRYPMLTLFASRDDPPGLELKFHEEWFYRGQPSFTPGRWAGTMFITEAGVVAQAGFAPRIRVSHTFVTTARRFPGRSQGAEWIWEFTQEDPTGATPSVLAGTSLRQRRTSTRKENWAFFTRELGVGIIRLEIGATYKTVYRSNRGNRWRGLSLSSASSKTREPVLMGRVSFSIRRWS